METMILSFVILLLIVGGMAIGVLMGGKPIAGSCGGMTALAWTWPVTCAKATQKCAKQNSKRRSKRISLRIITWMILVTTRAARH